MFIQLVNSGNGRLLQGERRDFLPATDSSPFYPGQNTYPYRSSPQTGFLSVSSLNEGKLTLMDSGCSN